MITSHAHQVSPAMTSSSETFGGAPGAGNDPNGGPPGQAESPAAFEDDFDIPPIHLPPSALEEPDYNNGAYQHQGQQQPHYHHHHHQVRPL